MPTVLSTSLARLAGAALLALVPWSPAQALVTQFTHATYTVDVRPGSDLQGWLGNGIQVTQYTTQAAITGDGVILDAHPGQWKTLAQSLKLHFQAKPGFTFTSVDFSHLLSWFVVEGSFTGAMSWVLDNGDGTPISGSQAPLGNGAWFNGGSWADTTQASPALPVDAKAFDLDITLNYTAAGYSGGCSSASGVCTQIGANHVKIWTNTAEAPPVPEPATLAMWLAGLGVVSMRLRRR
jgi:hypothetical protein